MRAVALGSTDGLQRGAEIIDTGAPVSVPVGEQTLGRVFNMMGDTIDDRGPIEVNERKPIHREPPDMDQLSAKTELFETGIKVMDLLCPLVRGGKAGLFGGCRRRQDGHHSGVDRTIGAFPQWVFLLRRCRRADP